MKSDIAFKAYMPRPLPVLMDVLWFLPLGGGSIRWGQPFQSMRSDQQPRSATSQRLFQLDYRRVLATGSPRLEISDWTRMADHFP